MSACWLHLIITGPGELHGIAATGAMDGAGLTRTRRPPCRRDVCRMGLEGIVSKRTDAPYRSGPSKTWLKSKNPASEAVRREREEEWR
jgi:hypothetical protein